jgi:hypothetical protein
MMKVLLKNNRANCLPFFKSRSGSAVRLSFKTLNVRTVDCSDPLVCGIVLLLLQKEETRRMFQQYSDPSAKRSRIQSDNCDNCLTIRATLQECRRISSQFCPKQAERLIIKMINLTNQLLWSKTDVIVNSRTFSPLWYQLLEGFFGLVDVFRN